MPRDENFTIKFNADISSLKSGITDANKNIQLANAEFKAAAAGMENWGQSSDGLKAKLKQLETILAAENEKLDSYKKQLELVTKKQAQNAKSAEELRKKHAEAVAQYGKNSAEAKKYAKELAAVEKEMASNEKEAQKLNVTILNQQGRVAAAKKDFAKFSDELKKVKKAEDEAAKSGKSVSDVLQDMGKHAKHATDDVKQLDGGFTILKGTIANLASTALSSLVSGFRTLSENTREMRLEMGKVETAFSITRFSAETAQKTFDDFYEILGDTGQATEAVSHLAKLARSEQDLATWTNIATGVYATFGNSLPIESLTEAANETAKTGELTGGLSDAITWAGMNSEWFEKKLSKCRNEQERAAFITKTLNGLYDDASTKYKTVNKDIMAANAAQNKMNKAMADVGQKIAPVTTALQNGFAKVLEKIMELVSSQDLEGFASKIADAFEKLIDDILPAVVDGLKWIIDNKDGIIAGIVGMGAAFAAMNVVTMIQGLVASFQAFKAAQEGATIAQWLLNAAMSANPIGLLIAGITALVAAFVYLLATSESFRETFLDIVNAIGDFFKNNWQDILLFLVNPFAGAFKLLYEHCDVFREFVDKWVAKIKDVFNAGVKAIVKFGTETIPEFLDEVNEWFSKVPGDIAKWLSNGAKKVVDWGSELAKKGKKAATDLITSITDTIKGIPDKMREVGTDIVKGLWNGINDMAGWVQKKISGFSESVLNGIKNFFGINSPSTVMEKMIGNNLVAGLVVGIDKKSKDAVNAMKDLSNGMLKPINGIISGANGNLSMPRAGGIGQAQVHSGATYNYTQINNSPKALSRLEIYKQTKNALNFATL